LFDENLNNSLYDIYNDSFGEWYWYKHEQNKESGSYPENFCFSRSIPDESIVNKLNGVEMKKEFDTFIEGLTLVTDMVKGHADKFILYATWGRKAGHKVLAENGWDTEGMAKRLADSYDRAGVQFGFTVSHVGKSFLQVYTHHPEIDLYNPDLTHPSYAGSVLSALTHYYTVFKEFPENTGSLVLESAVIDIFRKVVCK